MAAMGNTALRSGWRTTALCSIIVFCNLRYALPAFKGQRWVRLERGRIGMRCDTVKEERRTSASQDKERYKSDRPVSRVIERKLPIRLGGMRHSETPKGADPNGTSRARHGFCRY